MSDADLPAVVYRRATSGDAQDMGRLEQAAQVLLTGQGVHLRDLAVPDGIDEPTTWTLACVAELDGRIVGMARLTELDPALLCLDLVSVDPRYALRGIVRGLLLQVADAARALHYTEITGPRSVTSSSTGPSTRAWAARRIPSRIRSWSNDGKSSVLLASTGSALGWSCA